MYDRSEGFRASSGPPSRTLRDGSRRRGWYVAVAVVIGASLAVGEVAVAEDLDSTPSEGSLEALAEEPLGEAAPADPTSGPVLPSLITTGQNFQGSQLGVDSGFIPPDTMGSVGTDDIVEFLNGVFNVYDKTTGTQTDTASLVNFWTSGAPRVGLPAPPANTCDVPNNICVLQQSFCDNVTTFCRNNTIVDPRIIYDPDSGRWFAVSIDLFANNNIYVGRSDTDDPSGDWDGVRVAADTIGPAEFHDYPTLAVDADAITICTQDFDRGFGGGGVESCYSLPKADLLLAVPSVANMTRFESSPAGLPGVDGSIQATLEFGASDGRTTLLGVAGGNLVRSDILAPGAAGATLGAITGIAGDPGHANPPAARQPSPSNQTIENVAPRFVGNVVEINDRLWGVHAVAGTGGNSALRWYEIDEVNNTVIQTGLIENTDQDFYDPSIAANPFGNVVIGFTCSGPNLAPSSCASVGVTVSGVTTFEAPMILQLGAGHYWVDFNNPPAPERNRWGDYSATVVDPVSPCTFWTFQEFVAMSAVGDVGPSPLPEGGQWGVQISELAFNAAVATLPGSAVIDDTCVGASSTGTVEVCNTTPNSGLCANLIVTGISSSDPQFEVLEPSSDFPVVISPDFCFPFQVRFTPNGSGSQSAVLTVATNDPENPETTVAVSAGGTEPRIATLIADSGDFGDVCRDDTADLDLTISNSGGCALTVTNITSATAEFEVASVMSYPLVIAPGDSLAVPIRLAPTTLGPKSGAITVFSDDPDMPAKLVTVSGAVPPGDIRVTGSTDFGDVCAEELAEKPVSVCNVGACNLFVTSVTVDCPDFTLINNPFPAVVSPDSCEDVVVRFTPTSAGPKSCTLTILSDDPDMPEVTRTLTGNTPLPMIDVPPDQAFPPTVIQNVGACQSLRPFPVSNTGQCDLHITDLAVTTNPAEYGLSGLPSFPIILEPGHVAGEGDLRTVFAPDVLDRDRLGVVEVTYVSEPITGATTTVARDLCGEGVLTGVRVLATIGGVPIPTGDVFKLQLQRVTGNRKKRGLISIDVLKNPPLQTVTPAAPCTPYQFHGEFGTVDNPVQLLPGFYNVTVTARVNGKRKRKTAGFDLLTCDFNRNVVIDF